MFNLAVYDRCGEYTSVDVATWDELLAQAERFGSRYPSYWYAIRASRPDCCDIKYNGLSFEENEDVCIAVEKGRAKEKSNGLSSD